MHTKQTTSLWINHAISRYQKLGLNQKRLADDLGIEESRLSEMKQGRKRISPSQMDQIIDLCGAPKRGKGRFELAKIFKNVDDFSLSVNEILEDSFIKKIIKAYSRVDYIENLINAVIVDSDHFKNEENRNFMVINWINTTLKNKDFIEQCRLYQKSFKHPNSWTDWANDWINKKDNYQYGDKNCYVVNNVMIKNKKIFHALYLLAIVKNKFPEYEFNSNKKIQIDKYQNIPTVISGKSILVIKNFIKEPENSSINDETFKKYGYKKHFIETDTFYSYDDYKSDPHSMLFKFNSSLEPFFINDIRCELYLSEEMNYHLLIHFSESILGYMEIEDAEKDQDCDSEAFVDEERDHAIIIPNINLLELSNEIEKVRKWARLPTDNNYLLFKQIARAGGFIPGAQMLV